MASQVAAAEDPVEAELTAIAEGFRALAARLAVVTGATSPRQPGRVPPLAAMQVRRYLGARRLREQLLPAELFADPAWDILLALYASELSNQSVSITEACVASCVPYTTALRWLGRLEELELVNRVHDASDARRSHVGLTASARNGLSQWLEQVAWLLAPQQAGEPGS